MMTTGSQNFPFAEATIRLSKSRRSHALIIAGLFAAIGISSFLFGDGYVPDNDLVAIICVIGAVFVYGVSYGSWTEGVAMTVSGAGVWYKDWKLPVIPWRHVGRAYSTGIRLRPLLRIDLVDAEGFFSDLDDASLRKLDGHTLVKSDYLLIPNGILEIPISEIATIINAAAKRLSIH
jgi:hypothetical protein